MGSMPELPPVAAWRHRGARDGFEVVFLTAGRDGVRVHGHTTAVEDRRAFAVGYAIDLDARWRTRRAQVWSRSGPRRRTIALATDGDGRWTVDGADAAHLSGCLDVDLEASALTNAFPVHRLGLAPGAAADAPAAYVRALDLGAERLEQRYVRVDDGEPHQRYDYTSPGFQFRCELVYDESGLVLDYPGIAARRAI